MLSLSKGDTVPGFGPSRPGLPARAHPVWGAALLVPSILPVSAPAPVLGPLGGLPGLLGPPTLSLQEPVAKFSLKEIQSTRTQRPTAGSSYPYVEITLGDLLAQSITQLQLEQVGDTRGWGSGVPAGGLTVVARPPMACDPRQGLELCRVVAAHMERLLGAREKRLTLPPSEITLL